MRRELELLVEAAELVLDGRGDVERLPPEQLDLLEHRLVSLLAEIDDARRPAPSADPAAVLN
jgi:hypothetical protein